MAKPISFNKRENEKKKQAKRLEKQKKKEERKSNPGGGLDDMIAYVDENGRLTDTQTVKEEVNIDDVLIAVPKKEEIEVDPILKGRVEFYNDAKGFGFIKDLGSIEKYFFHISSAPEGITEGNKVTFELERGTRGMNAVKIKMD